MYVCVSAVFKTNQLYQNTKTQKGKSDKLDLIKVKNICSLKDIPKKKKKGKPQTGRNICNIYIRQRNFIQSK